MTLTNGVYPLTHEIISNSFSNLTPPTPVMGSKSAYRMQPQVAYTISHTSSNANLAPLGYNVVGSPYPKLHKKLDLIVPSGKNS